MSEIKDLLEDAVQVGNQSFAWKYKEVQRVVDELVNRDFLPESMMFWLDVREDLGELHWLTYSSGQPYYLERWQDYIQRMRKGIIEYLTHIDGKGILERERDELGGSGEFWVEIDFVTKQDFIRANGFNPTDHWLG